MRLFLKNSQSWSRQKEVPGQDWRVHRARDRFDKVHKQIHYKSKNILSYIQYKRKTNEK